MSRIEMPFGSCSRDPGVTLKNDYPSHCGEVQRCCGQRGAVVVVPKVNNRGRRTTTVESLIIQQIERLI